MKRVGIAIDSWKLQIFTRRLTNAGIQFTTGPGVSADTMALYVETDDVKTVAEVCMAANTEAFNVGKP